MAARLQAPKAPLNDSAPAPSWDISMSPIFEESLRRNTTVFRDLPQKLEKFVQLKVADPVRNKYGKHDRPMKGDLSGFWHAHLRDDAVVIWNLRNRCVNLVYIACHAEIEGKRLKLTERKLAPYGEAA